jgi:MoaA/NifB/PqqE/SkfB family radical SAM enzyme
MANLDRHAKPALTDLSFLWLELTNRCNLQCVHCYADSSPWSGETDVLQESDYCKVLDDAFASGCRKVQFIGGEATLNGALPALLSHARHLGYQFVDVYSNLVRLPSSVLESAEANGASFATSLYSDRPAIHDAITQRRGSHARTLTGIRKLLSRGIPIRVGFIEMEANQGHWERTADLLHSIGVTRIGRDLARPVGRAAKTGEPPTPDALCGQCWKGSLCVHPDGKVSPCIMSKAWSVGDIKSAGIGDILLSETIKQTRQTLHQYWRRVAAAGCIPIDGGGDDAPGACPPADGGPQDDGPADPGSPGGPGGPGDHGSGGPHCLVIMKDEDAPSSDA